ncbi:hypothetical protein [Mesorhizobium sp. IMUNJ 23232]|uniref:hypothetical protein n=1 Tax=Mesorhizobium sp. IMUNJ 23232 TaxID=3376064 RepID=UPI00379C782B
MLAAVFAALVGALSWLAKSAVAGMVWFYNRLTREIEMTVALRAEIETCVKSLETFAKEETASSIKAQMAASQDYRIFVPLDRDYFIFDLIKPDISLLPEASIREVVKFYDGMGAFDTLLASFQDVRFESFPVERRMGYIDSMIGAAANVLSDGAAATEVLANARRRLLAKRNVSLAVLVVGLGVSALGAGAFARSVAAYCGVG